MLWTVIENRPRPRCQLIRGSRASALLYPVGRYPLSLMAITIGTPARLRDFPLRLSPESRGARPPRVRCPQSRAWWSQSAAAPAAPKRHAVGRVARRARPDISSHFTNPPRLTLKAGRQAGLSTKPVERTTPLQSVKAAIPYLNNAFPILGIFIWVLFNAYH